MNKTLKILFDDFASKRLAEEPQALYDQLYSTVTAGRTPREENRILDMFCAYEIAVEAEAFTAGFNSAIQLFTSNN